MLDTVRDDDEYDTNDSFIDDVELDDYLQVDNSAIKHHVFLLIVGSWSASYHIRKPAAKKESDDRHNPKTIAKLGNKGRKASSLIQSNSTTQSHIVVMPNIHGANMQLQTAPANAAEVSIKKKTAYPNVKEDSSGLLSVRQRPKVPSSKNHSSTGEHSEPQTNSTHRSNSSSLLPYLARHLLASLSRLTLPAFSRFSASSSSSTELSALATRALYVETGVQIARMENSHGAAVNRIVNLTESTIASGDGEGCIKGTLEGMITT
ncbi:hypothetical protein OROMI_021014 [Orobanche minor]